MAVGMAIAERHLNAVYGDELVDHRTFVIAGDGDLMEGVNHEAVGLAGHLKLGRLIVLWDDNHITIDGSTDLSRNEDVVARHAAARLAYRRVRRARRRQGRPRRSTRRCADERPSLIRCKTIIGYGAPNKQGTAATHGAALGKDEVEAARKELGLDAGRVHGARRRAHGLARRPASAAPTARAEWHRRLDAQRRRRTSSSRRMAGKVDDGWLKPYLDELLAEPEAGRDPQGVGNGAGGDQRGDPGDDRRLGRPDRLEQHQDQGAGAADRRQLRRPLHLLRNPRVRHGGGDERHGAARRRDPLRRHVPGLHRLCAPGDPPVGAAEGAGSSM